jgi:hypothetical protein
MLAIFRTSVRGVAAGAALALGFSATVFAAAQTSQSKLPLHTVPTNLPGVYVFAQPPASFDPKRATDEELVAWGYPARPGPTEGPREWARWEQQVNPALHRVVPYLAKREGIYHRPLQGLKLDAYPSRIYSTAATSSNWSGFALVPTSGAKAYSSVTADWIVPTVKQAPGTCSGGWDYSSEWVGIGGFGDAFLLQSGSAANVFCDIGGNIAEYFPWIEWLPAAELVIYANAQHALLPFTAGDYLIVTVTATNWSGGVSKNGTLSFSDVTQGWTTSLTFTAAALGGSEVTGKSAEWIVERTEVNGSLATLPDYVADPWWFTRAEDLGAAFHYPGSPGNATAYQITMLDNNSANVSFVDLFGTDALWFFPEGSATK